MSTKRGNNASVIDVCTQRLNALKAHLSSTKATIAVNGVQTKAAEIIATYQASLDGRATLNDDDAGPRCADAGGVNDERRLVALATLTRTETRSVPVLSARAPTRVRIVTRCGA
jgi:hypothetical protein